VLLVGAHETERVVAEQSTIITWLQKIALVVPRLVALCSGSFFFAEAGLLDGSRATIHWSVSDHLRERFPNIDVQPDVIYTQQCHLRTSACASAATDIALAFVQNDYGPDVALSVTRDLVVFLKRPGGRSSVRSWSAVYRARHWQCRNPVSIALPRNGCEDKSKWMMGTAPCRSSPLLQEKWIVKSRAAVASGHGQARAIKQCLLVSARPGAAFVAK
ncbi:MAG: hypothetical protein ABI767_07990, partial [Rhodanobacter sp.]